MPYRCERWKRYGCAELSGRCSDRSILGMDDIQEVITPTLEMLLETAF